MHFKHISISLHIILDLHECIQIHLTAGKKRIAWHEFGINRMNVFGAYAMLVGSHALQNWKTTAGENVCNLSFLAIEFNGSIVPCCDGSTL